MDEEKDHWIPDALRRIENTLNGFAGGFNDTHEVIEQIAKNIATLEDLNETLERIATAVEKLVPQGSERERIALRLWSTLDVEAEASFRHADGWIAERDKQRAQQAERELSE